MLKDKKYLIVGILLLLSFSVFLPETFARPFCGIDPCFDPGFECDDPTGVCSNIGPGGSFINMFQCKSWCKPQGLTFDIAPLNTLINVPVTATWSSAALPFAGSCTGYVDNPDGFGGIITTPVLIPPSGTAQLQWSVPGSYSVYFSCTNPSGTSTSPTRTVVVTSVNPTLTISAVPASGDVSLSGGISYSLTSNDSRTAGDFICSRWSSPTVLGWENGVPALLDGSGRGSGAYGPIDVAGTYTAGISCLDRNTSEDAGSISATITANPYSGPRHLACVSSSCVSVSGPGPDRCTTSYSCNTGSLIITPPYSLVCVGQSVPFSAFYQNGSFTDRLGALANLSSDNASVISKTSEDAQTVTFTGNAPGLANIGGSYQGLAASTNVTVSLSGSCAPTFTAIPPNMGAWNLADNPGPGCDAGDPARGTGYSSQCIAINIGNGSSSAWANLQRTELEYDNWPNPWQRIFNTYASNFRVTDAMGNYSGNSYHSCDNDGTGKRVRGYRVEQDTNISFVGGGSSVGFSATKDCRGTVVVQNPQGSAWTINGLTAANYLNVTAIQGYADLGGGDISYEATDGPYVISGLSPLCSVLPLASQSVIPGKTTTFTISCSGGPASHKTCSGNSCMVVAGAGVDSCAIDSDCLSLTHKTCSGNSCVVVAGGGADSCTSDPECVSLTHKTCSGNSCVIVAGGGADSCTSDPECVIPTYKTCQGNSCVVLAGGGVDSCSVSADCVAPFVCTGSIPPGNSACPGTGANLTGDRLYELAPMGVCSVNQSDKCEYRLSLPGRDAVCLSVTAPDTVVAGQNFNATVVMKNTGSNTWTTPTDYHLGTQNPQDNPDWLDISYPNENRVFLPVGVSVGTGENASFNFTANTTYAPGVREFSWKMVQDQFGGIWFGQTCTKNIIVTAVSSCVGSPSQPCVSSANSCGQTNSGTQTRVCAAGTWGAWSACSATTPPESGCGSGQHLECQSSSCVWVPGSGPDLNGCLSPGTACTMPLNHLECRNNSCARIAGSGPNLDGCNSLGASCAMVCNMTAAPSVISKGGSSTISWTCNQPPPVIGCTLTETIGGVQTRTWPGVGTNDSRVVNPAKSAEYTLDCARSGVGVQVITILKVFSVGECNPNDPTCKAP